MSALDEMGSGRTLDALVAKLVMGCEVVSHSLDASDYACGCPDYPHTQAMTHARLPRYSTQIGAAWEVVRRMREAHNYLLTLEQFLMNSDEYEDWWARFTHRITDVMHESDPTAAPPVPAPLAICRAALRAVCT
jgi:hypothetical protein